MYVERERERKREGKGEESTAMDTSSSQGDICIIDVIEPES